MADRILIFSQRPGPHQRRGAGRAAAAALARNRAVPQIRPVYTL